MFPHCPPGARPEALALIVRRGRGAATVALLGRHGQGRVLWARPDGAAWLRLPDGVVGLAPPAAPLGPRWIQSGGASAPLTEGDTVVVDAAGLHGGDGKLLVERRSAIGWLGPLPDPGQVSAAPARALIADALAACRPTSLLEEPWRATVEPALAAIGRLTPLEALKLAARSLGGLGPGLTPSGDDVLSGILFAFRAMGGPTVEPSLVAVARTVRSSALVGSLLEAAAGGFHIEPVHDLVMASATGDASAAGKAAIELDRFGSSSGADVAYGLRVAFTRR